MFELNLQPVFRCIGEWPACVEIHEVAWQRFLRANLNNYFGGKKYRIVCQEIKIAILVESSSIKLYYIPLYTLGENL